MSPVRVDNANDALDAAIDMASAADRALETVHRNEGEAPARQEARALIKEGRDKLSKAREITGRTVRS